MSRRGDNIHKRKDGRWEGRYKSGVNEMGKTKYKSVYGKTYGECKEKLENAKLGKLSNTVNLTLNFSCILNIWLDNNKVRIKESTLLKYRHIINIHIVPELGYLKISSINACIVNAFLETKLKQGSKKDGKALSPSYVKTMAIIIESALDFAVKEGYCLPLKSEINKPYLDEKDITILTINEQRKYEKVLKKSTSYVALGTIIALYTGLRIGEICALHWKDIDLKNGLLYVNHTVSRVPSTDGIHKTKLILTTPKTKASKRVVPIPSSLKIVLDSIENKSGFVVSNTITFIDTRTFEYRFKNFLIDNDLLIINFHALRHTFATRCLQYGMDVKTLSEILGHASATTTLNTYTHTSLDVKRKQLETALKKCS